MCNVTVCACIRSAELQSSKSLTKGFILSKRESKADPDRAETPHSNTRKYLRNAVQKKAWFQ